MSFQTTLTEDAPVILDATCSDKRIWPHEPCIRMDVRREMKPDLVADARSLPFRSGVFDLIYCDPPHVIDAKGWDEAENSPWFVSVNRKRKGFSHQHFHHSMRRFGFWKTQIDWFSFIEGTNIEFSRCLKDSGLLKYKIMAKDGKKFASSSDLEQRMSNFEIIKKKITISRNKNPVHWLTMKPKPDSARGKT